MNSPFTKTIKYSFDKTYGDINIGGYAGFGFSSLNSDPHRHEDYYEITIVISGVYTHTYKSNNVTITPGTLLLMGPRSEHQLYTEPLQATFFAICIREDYFLTFLKQHFPEFAGNALPKCTTVHLDTTDFGYLEQLGRQMSVAKPSLYVADMITYLTLVNVFYKKNLPSKKTALPVQRIIEILNEPSNLNMPMNNLYAAVGKPVPVLLKAFKEQTGYTIVGYRNMKKMEFAANMLRNTDKKVIDIAFELHFESLSYFLRSFKKEFGITPTEYRKAHKK